MGSLLFLALFCEPIDPQIAAAIAVAMLDTRRTIEVPITVDVKRELTDAEQDAAYLRENHWRLSPGSCTMLNCPIHRVWELVPGPAAKEQPPPAGRAIGGGGQAAGNSTRCPAPPRPERKPQDAGSVTMDGSTANGAGCPNGKCGIKLFRPWRQKR